MLTVAGKPGISHHALVTSKPTLSFNSARPHSPSRLSARDTHKSHVNGKYMWRNKSAKLHTVFEVLHGGRVTATFTMCCSYGSVSSSKTIKNSRLVSQKDDVHVCIMCLRAIMNYQVPNGVAQRLMNTWWPYICQA